MFLNKCVGIYDEMINKMTRNNGKDKPFLELYLDFKTEQGSINFKNYLLGDFARACLYLSKTNVNLYFEPETHIALIVKSLPGIVFPS